MRAPAVALLSAVALGLVAALLMVIYAQPTVVARYTPQGKRVEAR